MGTWGWMSSQEGRRMEGGTGRWMHGSVGEQRDGRREVRTGGWVGEAHRDEGITHQADRWVERGTERWGRAGWMNTGHEMPIGTRDGWVDGRVGGAMDGWTDGQMEEVYRDG